jgi:CxxC motif-containing protein (DUF1111 family)
MKMSMFHRRKFNVKTLIKVFACASFLLLVSGMLSVGAANPTDPGPQGGPPDAGGPLVGLDPATEVNFFEAARFIFEEFDSVSVASPINDNPFPAVFGGPAGGGLGPTFNANSCSICHAQPAVGGTSPGTTSLQTRGPGVIGPVTNPQIPLATLHGAENTVPSFITATGPMREARFILNSNGTTDGGVHGLFTIQGRTDAPGCVLAQPNFAQQEANFNVINRIPTPVFGLGLVENTPDATLQANLTAEDAAAHAAGLDGPNGINGKFNTSGNDGTITRFGWKAQNKSLLIFAGEAYNVEVGVSNENFPNERSAVAGCVFNATPEDGTNGISPGGLTPTVPPNTAAEVNSDVTNFAGFMRLSAPPTPISPGPGGAAAVAAGKALFTSVGCSLCHSPSLTTAASPFTGQSNVTYHPFSDFAVHHMGSTLADGVTQGGAGPDEFRTAPLWGAAQRLFFLHDGRTSSILTAIEDHFSNPNDCVETETVQQFEIVFQVQGVEAIYNPNPTIDEFCGSEANGVINNFNNLSSTQQQEILDFVRSL